MGFEGLLGNERLKENLRISVGRGRSAHFYLISGPAGSGKHTLAKLLAEENAQEKVEAVTLIGLCTDICVVSNACVLQAKYPEARIIVDAQLTASMDPVMHEKVLDVLEGFQVKVINR